MLSHTVHPSGKNQIPVAGIDSCVWIAAATEPVQCCDRLSVAAAVGTANDYLR